MRALLLAVGLLSPLAQMNISTAQTRPPAQTRSPVVPTPTFTKPQSNYLLGCGGCHGENGISNSKLVPDLNDQVGYYLNVPEGREYLVRLPNVAFSIMSDQELTDVLNFMVFRIGGASVPARAAPYTVDEVARLRKRPLNEVSLVDYRKRLVEVLIDQHQASQKLRVYGSDRY
jgi:mono/diheme cytochrome c family protein